MFCSLFKLQSSVFAQCAHLLSRVRAGLLHSKAECSLKASLPLCSETRCKRGAFKSHCCCGTACEVFLCSKHGICAGESGSHISSWSSTLGVSEEAPRNPFEPSDIWRVCSFIHLVTFVALGEEDRLFNSALGCSFSLLLTLFCDDFFLW